MKYHVDRTSLPELKHSIPSHSHHPRPTLMLAQPHAHLFPLSDMSYTLLKDEETNANLSEALPTEELEPTCLWVQIFCYASKGYLLQTTLKNSSATLVLKFYHHQQIIKQYHHCSIMLKTINEELGFYHFCMQRALAIHEQYRLQSLHPKNLKRKEKVISHKAKSHPSINQTPSSSPWILMTIHSARNTSHFVRHDNKILKHIPTQE